MVLLRHPLYVAVGATVAVYGIAYALVSGEFLAAAVTTFPGAWLVGYGLLNGIALAVDDTDRSPRSVSSDDDDSANGDDDETEESDALASSPVFRTPY
ncbi:hypothetical protein [Halobaculum limi]|uniref:hypothetical protein n=1 Tax=Halobaculum limi TaxID=3031916 RepID=UPI002406D385|nr:hypothetical protein [Halobaculum sp. YSMS11]